MATDNMGIRVNRSRTLEEIGQLRLKRIDKALTRFIIIVVETNLRILHPCFSFERRKKITSISERFSCEIYVRGDTLRAVFFFSSFFFSRGIIPEFILRSSSRVVCNVETAIPHGLKMLEQSCDLVGKFASFAHPSIHSNFLDPVFRSLNNSKPVNIHRVSARDMKIYFIFFVDKVGMI